jgi:predicted AlkP superfamily pyrophosphatase or phosphodiesterase
MKPNCLTHWHVHVLAILLLSCGASLLRGAQVNYVVHVSLDGLGAKYLQFYVTNAPAQFPWFNWLMTNGAYTFEARCDYDYSETVPNHITMFTARPVSQPAGATNTLHHGYSNNFPSGSDTIHANGNPSVPYKASFFDVAHDFGRTTAFYASKTRLQICDRSYDVINGALDGEGTDNGKDKIDFASVVDLSGANVANLVNTLVLNLSSSTPTNYSFIHISEPDLTGHSSGWGSANWSNSVRNVDLQLGRIITCLTTNALLTNDVALIVSADHGGIGNSHTDATRLTNYTIPFFLWSPSTPPNSDLYSLFANRGNPGTNRVDWNAIPQPIRNADGGNLALNLLGLPPIPGSFAVPIFGATNVTMNVARATNGTHTIWWPGTANAFVVESASSLGTPIAWQTITNGVINNGGMLTYSVTNLGSQFYRLRKL